jgi:hypothetical protein
MSLYSDSVWFWRVSEGVKGTKMKPWKTKLSEDERWKVIAFESTFALKGQEWDVAANKWVPAGTAGKPGAPAVEAGGAEGEAPATGEAEAPSAGEEAPSEEKSPE